MWEPRTDADAQAVAPSEILGTALLSGGLLSGPGNMVAKTDRGVRDIPAELLILNRYGIKYPFIRAASRIAARYKLDGREVLLRAGIITEEIWLDSQRLLDLERANALELKLREQLLLDQATNNLRRTLPEYSASKTFTKMQACALCLIAIVFFSAIFLGQKTLVEIGLITASAFYTIVVLVRAFMLAAYDNHSTSTQLSVSVNEADLPVYSILVPLYDEANQVEELTEHLALLNWPKEKLEVKLICEKNDLDTIAAIHDAGLPGYFNLVIVPDAVPKTKPKALNYALPEISGEFAVIYDAEDRPHPDQLREAFVKFSYESAELVCLQAPLQIRNKDRNLITRMFFIEYLTLFNGILPVLALWKFPIPLGGTSNHFKVAILKETGAWDPFNVTEDADLGIRLFREGYRSSTISLPTLEEAPPYLWPWIKQRTRWLKGWMQTILVHNRNPLHLYTDLGFKNGCGFHLLLTSVVLSSLLHPLFLVLIFSALISNPDLPGAINFAIGIGIFNLVAGYTTYGLFALLVLKKHGHGKFASQLIFVPFYWLMISVAGWRALFHLLIKPHRWEKTPHGLEIQ